jgi:hypothetical protein
VQDCNPHGGTVRSDGGPRVTYVLGIVVVNLRGASAWLGQDTLLCIVVGLMWGIGQDTLLGQCS